MLEKKLILAIILFVVIPIISVFSLIISLLLHLNLGPRNIPVLSLARSFSSYGMGGHFASLPTTISTLDAEVIPKDAREEILRDFFTKYESPLLPYAKYIVEVADQYDLDFRLIPAIAMQESNLCKHIPEGSHNCWGFGIYGDKITRFDDYGDAIAAVTKTLATKYRDRGLDTPHEIMTMYTPSSNGSWAHGVSTFMSELQ